MSVDAASLRTVVVQLRSLAADKDNQPIIARDEGCMSALSNFIQSEDADVCKIAVDALQQLSSHRDNRDVIRNDFGIADSVRLLVVNKSLDVALRRDAVKVLRNVLDAEDEDEVEEIKEIERRGGLRVDTVQPEADAGYILTKDPITLRVHVPGISDADFLDDFEHRLIRTRGVLSLSYEMGAEVVIVFSRVEAEDIERIIRQISGKEVEILPEEVSDDEGEEKEESEADGEQHNDDENVKKDANAEYIDEERERYRKFAEKAKRSAVSRQGYSSLAQRLEEERKQSEREKARSERMLGRIGRKTSIAWSYHSSETSNYFHRYEKQYNALIKASVDLKTS